MVECIEGGWVKWRGGLDQSTIVCINLFFSLSISNYDVKVVRDYPNLEVLCTMDGFKLHHNVTDYLNIFVGNKIRSVKEEVVTSYVNQS